MLTKSNLPRLVSRFFSAVYPACPLSHCLCSQTSPPHEMGLLPPAEDTGKISISTRSCFSLTRIVPAVTLVPSTQTGDATWEDVLLFCGYIHMSRSVQNLLLQEEKIIRNNDYFYHYPNCRYGRYYFTSS